MTAVGVIGSGAWGTTLALMLAKKGIVTTLWEHRPERAAEMPRSRENRLFLPGLLFPIPWSSLPTSRGPCAARIC